MSVLCLSPLTQSPECSNGGSPARTWSVLIAWKPRLWTLGFHEVSALLISYQSLEGISHVQSVSYLEDL